jgi:hypothetical protein
VYSDHLRSIISAGALKVLSRLSIREKKSFEAREESRVEGIRFQMDFKVVLTKQLVIEEIIEGLRKFVSEPYHESSHSKI